MPDTTVRIAIIGGGVAGLATACDLEHAARERNLSLDLTLFESKDCVGGKLHTIRDSGFLLEAGPNGWLDNEPATGRLLGRLGLETELLCSEEATRHRFVFRDGKLRELPLSPPAFLRSDILPLSAKLRMAAELFIPARKNLGIAADDPSTDETVFDFGRRRLGTAFAETLLDPMVKGVFGGDARRLSLAAAFPRMVELERDYGGLLKAMFRLGRERRTKGNGSASAAGPGGKLHSFRLGMAELPRSLHQALQGEVLTGQPVTSLRLADGAWWVQAGEQEYGPFTAVVDAVPAHAAARHVPDPELARHLNAIPYAPMAVITLAFHRKQVEHSLRGFGMLNPSREQRQLLGVLWTTSIFKGRAPADKIVLRCMVGGATNPDLVTLSDAELVELCLAEQQSLYGLQGVPVKVWIFRHEKAIAQYETGHLTRLAAIEAALESWPGLFLTGSSYRGVSVNHCIAEAERTTTAVLSWLNPRSGQYEPGASVHTSKPFSRMATT